MIFLATMVVASSPASAATATEWKVISLSGGGTFDNYDYEKDNNRSVNNVDWAIDLIWINNATVDDTSAGWSTANPHWVRGATEYAFTDGYYDSDKGLKQYSNGSCAGAPGHSAHSTNYGFRVFAPPGKDNFYSSKYGYYVIGAAQNDYAQNCTDGTSWDGANESAESYVMNLFAGNGYAVHHNAINLSNAQTNTEGTHRWDNTGYATTITVQ